MPSTFLGLNTGLTGLNYFQSSLNSTSHNISNANTKGYSRQEISATAANPVNVTASYGMVGTGISGVSVDRLRNVYYDNKYWAANSKCNKYEAEEKNLSQLQTYMNELSGDSGYTKWMSQLSQSLQDIADNPSDYTTRISYTLTADSFTDMVNEIADSFQTTQKNINDEIELVVSEINSLSKQIYELTQQIIMIEIKGANANDLRDQRDVCIDKLSDYVDVDVTETSIMFGTGLDAIKSSAETMCVRIDGNILVDEMGYSELMVVPRSQNVNLGDSEGLCDVYWKNSDETAGAKFRATQTTGRLSGLLEVRDGNNCEAFSGKITGKTDSPASATVTLDRPINVNKLNIPSQGTINLNGKDYMYDGWEAEYDEDGNMNNFVFTNLTMYDIKGVEVAAVLPDNSIGHIGIIGENIDMKGIPYYMAQLNEFVRTFSDYMNSIVTEGVDKDGNPGLDMYTAEDVAGNDFVLKGTMPGIGTITSADSSYYRLNALNWELNSSWKDDPSKVVVSYKEDVEQGNIESRPILDKIIFGLTDQGMFSQGTPSQFLQAITTNMAVDISKLQVFSSNQDDIRYTIDGQRKSVSGVDANEEAANLVKFQDLYNLASKVISVLNEVYDKLINATGV